MKITKIPASRTGIFVILSFSLLVIAFFLIGNKQKLFSNTSTYFVKFKEISGLKKGAQVTITGINVGSVSSIDLPTRSGDSVLVAVHIIKDAQNLLHTDSKATVTTEGLVGDKTIAITVGTATTPIVPPEGFIIGQSPRDLMGIVDTAAAALDAVKNLTVQASGIIEDMRSGKGSIGKLLTDDGLYKDIRAIVNNTDRSIAIISRTADKLGVSIDSTLGNLAATSTEFKLLASSINNGKGTVGKLLNDTEIYSHLLGLTQSINSTVAELHDAMTKISAASGNTVEFTEALKHNFLVKGYFEDRGYWSTSTLEKNIQTRIDSLQQIESRIDGKLKQLKR